jgi:hypothetical protein
LLGNPHLAGEMLARESASGLVRVHDARGLGELRPGQVVIGHEDAHPEPVRFRDALDRRDAVVDCDEPIGRSRGGLANDLRREPVRMLEAVRHDVLDRGAHRLQRLHSHRARRGAIRVVVGDDQEPLALADRVGEQARGIVHVRQPVGRDQRGELRRQLVGAGHAARGEEAGEARIDPAGHEARERIAVDGAFDDLRHTRPGACARGAGANGCRS